MAHGPVPHRFGIALSGSHAPHSCSSLAARSAARHGLRGVIWTQSRERDLVLLDVGRLRQLADDATDTVDEGDQSDITAASAPTRAVRASRGALGARSRPTKSSRLQTQRPRLQCRGLGLQVPPLAPPQCRSFNACSDQNGGAQPNQPILASTARLTVW